MVILNTVETSPAFTELGPVSTTLYGSAGKAVAVKSTKNAFLLALTLYSPILSPNVRIVDA